MELVEKQVQRAWRRLLVQSLAVKLAWCWFAAFLLSAIAIVAGKFWLPNVDQQVWAAGWLGGGLALGLISAAAWTWLRRRTTIAAALELDHRFGLKERVSSSLALDPASRDSAAGRALLRDAAQRVGSIEVADRFGFALDRRALLPLLAAGVAFALAALVPVATPVAPAKTATAASVQVQAATKTLVKRLEARKKDAAEKGLPEAEALVKLEEGVKKLNDPQKNDRKQTLLVLNDLVKDAQRRREELADSADLKKQLAQLKNLDQQGPGERLGSALKNGQLEKAIEEIAKLKKQIDEGKLGEEQQKELAKQLDQLQQQLNQQAAARKEQMEKLQEQLESHRREGNQEAAERVQEQLEKLAKQHGQEGKVGQMAAQLEQAAQSLSQGNSQEASEALSQLGDQLGGMQDSLQEMEALDQALDEISECKQAMACSECQGQGCSACQGGDEWTKRFGELGPERLRGTPGKGIGVGYGPGLGDETDPEGKFYDSSVKQQPGRGGAKVIGEADGPNRKGTVQQQIQEELSAGAQSSADALSDQRLPHDYRDHAQKYFDSLREGKN